MTIDERTPPRGAAGLTRESATDLAWERVRHFLRDHGCALTRAEATRLGLTDNDLRGLVRRGRLARVAHGAYIWPDALTTPVARHLGAARALVRARPEVAVSHVTAAVLHRLPVLRVDLEHLHLTYRTHQGQTRRRAGYTVHRLPALSTGQRRPALSAGQRDPAPDLFTEVDGLPVVVPALAVLGTALVAGIPSGIAAADGALRRGLVSEQELEGWLERMRHTPGLGAARHVVTHASPTAESAGESLTRLVLVDLGYAVIPQFRIVVEGGRVLARVDFYLPELGVVVEFDGRIKYDGLDGAAALAAEKQREDGIRALGYGVARLVWADLFHPARVRAAIEQAARTATRRG